MMGGEVIHSLSPQAKRMLDRSYRGLHRIVHICTLDDLSSLEKVRAVLRKEVGCNDNHFVHSPAGEIPTKRFAIAETQRNCDLGPFSFAKFYTSARGASFHGNVVELAPLTAFPHSAMASRYSRTPCIRDLTFTSS